MFAGAGSAAGGWPPPATTPVLSVFVRHRHKPRSDAITTPIRTSSVKHLIFSRNHENVAVGERENGAQHGHIALPQHSRTKARFFLLNPRNGRCRSPRVRAGFRQRPIPCADFLWKERAVAKGLHSPRPAGPAFPGVRQSGIGRPATGTAPGTRKRPRSAPAGTCPERDPVWKRFARAN